MTENSELEGLSLLGDGEQFRDALCEMIESAPMFTGLSYPEVKHLAGYLRAYEAKKGTIIFREGDKGRYLCIVLKGRVDIFKNTPDHTRKKVATVRAGKSMGEMSLLDELPYSATAEAREDTTLLMLTKLNFERLAEEQPVLCIRLLRQVARLMSLRLRQTTGILLDYLSDDANSS